MLPTFSWWRSIASYSSVNFTVNSFQSRSRRTALSCSNLACLLAAPTTLLNDPRVFHAFRRLFPCGMVCKVFLGRRPHSKCRRCMCFCDIVLFLLTAFRTCVILCPSFTPPETFPTMCHSGLAEFFPVQYNFEILPRNAPIALHSDLCIAKRLSTFPFSHLSVVHVRFRLPGFKGCFRLHHFSPARTCPVCLWLFFSGSYIRGVPLVLEELSWFNFFAYPFLPSRRTSMSL